MLLMLGGEGSSIEVLQPPVQANDLNHHNNKKKQQAHHARGCYEKGRYNIEQPTSALLYIVSDFILRTSHKPLREGPAKRHSAGQQRVAIKGVPLALWPEAQCHLGHLKCTGCGKRQHFLVQAGAA